MLDQWARLVLRLQRSAASRWYRRCGPTCAVFPPIYIQAGRSEILYDSIQAFADRARSQGAEVVLETWEDMNHVFQMFGPDVPQSAEALRRIGEVIDARVRGEKRTEAVSTAGP